MLRNWLRRYSTLWRPETGSVVKLWSLYRPQNARCIVSSVSLRLARLQFHCLPGHQSWRALCQLHRWTKLVTYSRIIFTFSHTWYTWRGVVRLKGRIHASSSVPMNRNSFGTPPVSMSACAPGSRLNGLHGLFIRRRWIWTFHVPKHGPLKCDEKLRFYIKKKRL
jgi:hypothetical protein